jgi:SAM-dependent methyltransferase
MEEGLMMDHYHQTRFINDPRRLVLWQSLWRFYFSHLIEEGDTVLDLGCAYGNFINQVQAKKRIAVDRWPGFTNHIEPGIQTIVADITDLSAVENASVDFAFASNVFEHMSQNDTAITLAQLKHKLSSRGQLVILQPNYRYCASEYFDDYTHISIWSHISLADFLVANGYEVSKVVPRFLPLTIQSRFPVHPFLIALYLRSPFKPFSKQMLLMARPR